MDFVTIAVVAIFGAFVYGLYWLVKHHKSEDEVVVEEDDPATELVKPPSVITSNRIVRSAIEHGNNPRPFYTDPPKAGDDLFDEAVMVATAAALMSDNKSDDILGPAEPQPEPVLDETSKKIYESAYKEPSIGVRDMETANRETRKWEPEAAEPVEELKTESVSDYDREREADREADKAEDASDAAADAAEDASDSSSGSGSSGSGDD